MKRDDLIERVAWAMQKRGGRADAVTEVMEYYRFEAKILIAGLGAVLDAVADDLKRPAEPAKPGIDMAGHVVIWTVERPDIWVADGFVNGLAYSRNSYAGRGLYELLQEGPRNYAEAVETFVSPTRRGPRVHLEWASRAMLDRLLASPGARGAVKDASIVTPDSSVLNRLIAQLNGDNNGNPSSADPKENSGPKEPTGPITRT